MGLDDRLAYLMIGCAIGFILGYFVRALRDIKEELHEVDEIVKKQERGEAGFMRFPMVANAALILVLGLSLWASFTTQKVNNELADTQDSLVQAQAQIERVTFCNQRYFVETIVALNYRTEYSGENAEANIALQRAQAVLLRALLVEPPPAESVARQALREYFDQGVSNFIKVNERAARRYKAQPYPTEDEFVACLENRN